MADLFETEIQSTSGPRPLADRLRPMALEEVIGQDHLVGADGSLTQMIAGGVLGSLVFWGPPGVGKTTIARLLALNRPGSREIYAVQPIRDGTEPFRRSAPVDGLENILRNIRMLGPRTVSGYGRTLV